ncbi:hypothetical protein [Sphaerisporangium sp. NPDC051011]|uniref:hypothetical protein n=1 Tax=Sphaerisporangium sp. NPDC051011 TaxID=3155792 RepID=UPI0033DDDAC7
MPAIRTRAIVITLPVRRWEALQDGLAHGELSLSSDGWCDACDRYEYDLCTCSDKLGRAMYFHQLGEEIGRELTRTSGRLTLILTAEECCTVVEALHEGARYLVALPGFDCLNLGAPRLCDDCAAIPRQAAALRTLAARVDRRVRQPHARPNRPGVAAFLAAKQEELDEHVQAAGADLGDMTRTTPASAEDWEWFYDMLADRKQLAAQLTRRPRRPAGSRARTGHR